ncbi:MAG TPA: class I SAM-dependent methyltransferase [Prosthecobacter sp.]|nr:class I SAM-dependent methyltransferase [Prosthecobacter sp.]
MPDAAPSANDPPPRAEFDAFAEDYDQALNRGLKFSGETKEYFAEGRVNWLRARLSAAGHTAERCLDFGCGTGTAFPYLQAGLSLEDYLGYDPSSESVKEAGGLHPRAKFTADAGDVPESAFDLAFTNGVFHHIPPEHRAQAARLVWRALKPGGWFAFWENNRWNPVVHFMMSRVPFDRDAQMLFPHQARAQLRDAGFQIVLGDSLFVFPGSLKMLRPLEPLLCKLPLGGQYLVLARKPPLA